MIRICVFDLDGTTVDTTFALQRSVSVTMEDFGYRGITIPEVKVFAGTGGKNMIRKALLANGDTELKDLDRVLLRYNENFKKNCTYRAVPYEGMPEALAELKERGILLAILSNKSQERSEDTVFTAYGKTLFDRVYGERKGIPLKPDPSSLFSLLNEFHISPEECMYFGDTNTDMQTGTGAGAVTVGVLWGFRGKEELEAFHPYDILSAPSEIPALVNRFSQAAGDSARK